MLMENVIHHSDEQQLLHQNLPNLLMFNWQYQPQLKLTKLLLLSFNFSAKFDWQKGPQ